MRPRGLLLLLPLLLSLPLLPIRPAPAGEHEVGHQNGGSDGARSARAALQAGEIRPLADLLAGIESRYDGRVIETELEREHGRWIYEFKLLPPAGHLFVLTIDAATGEVLRSRGPVREKR